MFVSILDKQPSSDLQYEFLYSGAFTMLKIQLQPGQKIKAESGAMVAMSPTIDVEGKLEGGLLGGLGRLLSGEKFFFQTLHAQRGSGEVLLSPTALGDLTALELDGTTSYVVQKDGFFASSNGVEVSTTMQNLAKGLFSGEGFFVLKIAGKGTLFVSSYGNIHPVTLAPGEEIVIDNSHLVAWPENIQYTIDKASAGWFSTITSGEGLVCRFRGPGTVYIQTRNPQGFADWIRSMIPTK